MNGWSGYTRNWWTVVVAGGVFSVSVSTMPSRVVAQQPTVASQTTTPASAEPLLARHVTIHLAKVSLKRAIDSVSRVANVFVAYQLPLLRAQSVGVVTVDVTDKPLGMLLEQILNGTGLRVVSVSGNLAIVPSASSPTDSVPGVGVVSGQVVDSATEHGLSGVTVKLAGTKISALTGDSGRFILRDVPVGQRVVAIKGFGYRPSERMVDVSATQRTTIRVRLVAVPNTLSGVVTTATGLQRKVEVGNDITTLNVDSIRQVAPISSVTDLLETRVPGLSIKHSSGTPGDPSKLLLRGPGSIQLSNDPILIVDGIRVYASASGNLAPSQTGHIKTDGSYVSAYNAPSPLDQIDPSSIETIAVLKGPSASAMYGSDAANGVIVITTKKGRAGPAHWNADLASGLNWLPGNWPTNYFRFGWNDVHNGLLCNWWDASCSLDSLVTFQALNDPHYTVFSHGTDQQASLTVSGGVPTMTYSLTGSTQATLGNLKLPESEVQRYDSLYGPTPRSLVRPDKYTTWSVDGKLTVVPQPTLMATFQSSLFNSTQKRSSLESAINQLEGEYLTPEGPLSSSTLGPIAGPLISGEYERVTSDKVMSNNSVMLQWQPKPWLPLTATGGISSVQSNDGSYVPFGVCNGGDCVRDTTGSYGLGRLTSRTSTLRVNTQVPAFRNRITTAVGFDFSSTSEAYFQDYTNQLAPGVTEPETFTAQCSSVVNFVCYSPGTQTHTALSTYGWYIAPRLSFASRLFAAPGFRLDGGSGGTKSSGAFGGLSAFPKMDFSYLAVDRQDERPLWGVLSLFRPRIAYGYAGTQPAPADKLRLYNLGNAAPFVLGSSDGCSSTVTLDGTHGTPALCLETLGNSVLHPERSSELEGGFEAELWQNRVSITISQYNKTRHDAIISVPVAQSVVSNQSGSAFSIQKNIGVVRNTGTEITMAATPFQRRMFGWSINGNFTKNTNVVVRLNQGQNPIILNGAGNTDLQQRVQAGYPLFADFARPITDYADANGDGVIEANEIRYGDSTVYLGNTEPNYQLNVANDVSLFDGRLSLHMNLAYQNGFTQDNSGSCASNAFLLLPNNPATSLGLQAAMIASGCTAGEYGIVNQTVTPIGLVQTVNTLRFQSLSVNYVVPARVAHWAHVPRMSVALQGENLGLLTSYRGMDPGVSGTGVLPLPRIWMLHVTVGN